MTQLRSLFLIFASKIEQISEKTLRTFLILSISIFFRTTFRLEKSCDAHIEFRICEINKFNRWIQFVRIGDRDVHFFVGNLAAKKFIQNCLLQQKVFIQFFIDDFGRIQRANFVKNALQKLRIQQTRYDQGYFKRDKLTFLMFCSLTTNQHMIFRLVVIFRILLLQCVIFAIAAWIWKLFISIRFCRTFVIVLLLILTWWAWVIV